MLSFFSQPLSKAKKPTVLHNSCLLSQFKSGVKIVQKRVTSGTAEDYIAINQLFTKSSLQNIIKNKFLLTDDNIKKIKDNIDL